MDDSQKKLLESFKPGEYCVLSIMVKNKDLTQFINVLKSVNLDLAVFPDAKAKLDFANPDVTGTEQ